MLGLYAPLTGRLDAQTTLAGTYPDIAMNVHAALYGGTAARLSIERFEIMASAVHGRGTIESARLDLPFLSTLASGSFGLRPNDQLSLVAHSTSDNIGAFLNRATGKVFGLSGALDSQLRIDGTRDRPQLRDTIALASLRYGKLSLPRVAAEIDADRDAVSVRDGEVDLANGKALLSARVPVRLAGANPGLGEGAIAGTLTAEDVELSNFSDLLPKGSRLSGRIDGSVDAGGTTRAPLANGSLALRDATFSVPGQKSPFTGISANLSLLGTQASISSHVSAGGGILTAQAVASLADLRHAADASLSLQARASNARFDIPAYFQGTVNGELTVARRAPGPPEVGGDVSIENARIPLTALLNQKSASAPSAPVPDVALKGVRIAAGSNVRVQSANVDVGATGAVTLGGTLTAPSLAGSFRSTGGSLNFYRNFNLQSGTVTFDPSSGLIPDVDAVATTFVSNPATAIRLHVTGAVTNMDLALASDPSYSREQILGLLVGAQQFGAVRGVQSTSGGNASAGAAAQSLAFGQLNTVFTRNLLEPLSASVGNALGFTEVQITSDIQSGLGVNAVKAFGKNVNAIFAQSFGYPKTQSIALEAHPDPATGLRVTAYSSEGPTLFAIQQQPQPIGIDALNLNPLTAFTPITGSNGIAFSYLRKFP
jgi:autotransporter translocation and assembly factor TamB